MPASRTTRWSLAGAVACAVALMAGCGDGPGEPALTGDAVTMHATAAPTPATAGLVRPQAPRAVPVLPAGSTPTAQIRRRTWLRATPGGRRLAVLGRRTEWGGPRVLAVLGRRPGWVAVTAPELPNGRRGWIAEAAVEHGYSALTLHADISERELVVRRGRRVLRRVSVAVGRPGNETPPGRYGVTDKLALDGGGPYGCCVLALSGHQERLPSGWGGGDRLAVHGTTAPESIGSAASLGCMRASEADLRALMAIVPLGATVTISA